VTSYSFTAYAFRKPRKEALKSRKESKMKTHQQFSKSANAAQDIRPRSIFMIFLFVLGAMYLHAQVVDPSGGAPYFSETFYIKDNARNRKPEPYNFERESDVMWSKRVWRTIDCREKFNHPIYYPENPINDRKSLFDVIKTGVLSGEIYAFDNPFFDDEFKVKMSRSTFEGMFTWYDSTNYVQNPNDPDGPMILAPIRYDLTSRDVKQYWVKEDWFFDRQRSVMDVRILGICPLKEKVDPTTGEMIGVSPLFWIYFPQCRNLFAKSEVFNTKNDAQRNTYDDLFTQRMFSSFVRKESNVYDREIASYATGLDALLEADRVKDDIFKTEHDVWHF
jgi:gliding motility associated protien GldN